MTLVGPPEAEREVGLTTAEHPFNVEPPINVETLHYVETPHSVETKHALCVFSFHRTKSFRFAPSFHVN